MKKIGGISPKIEQFCRRLETTHDSVQRLSKDFCDLIGVTVFAYVRVKDDGQISWVTSNPAQDRFLLQSASLAEEPLVDTPLALREGQYLWFCDRKFEGSEAFYRERAKRYQMDHGMVLVRHKKGYLETCCFSGLLAKNPLYNLFTSRKGIFCAFMDNFTKSLDRKINDQLENGLHIREIKNVYGKNQETALDPTKVALACGCKELLLLSSQEKRCLELLPQGLTYEAIGKKLHLSPRTVEYYIESCKNKLGVQSRHELCQFALLVQDYACM